MEHLRQFKEWQHYFIGADFTNLGNVAEPLGNNPNRYYIVIIVHYLHWTGPVYFNLIRPFHHLVVWRMARAGARDMNLNHEGHEGHEGKK